MSSISDKELSIIIQGAPYQGKNSTDDVIKSARDFFPNAEIILSTWLGVEISNKSKALLDRVILSQDPGDGTHEGKPLNINRQLVSTLSGLKAATRKYAIKTRTDIKFTSSHICRLMGAMCAHDRVYEISKGKIIACDITTRTHLKPNWLQRASHKSLTYMPFWVCDFFYAGLTEDLFLLFDIELYPEEFYTCYSKDKPVGQLHTFKYTPESYITYKFLSKYDDVDFQYSFDNNSDAIRFYESRLLDNLIIESCTSLGIDSIKYYLPMLPPRQRLLSTEYNLLLNKKHGCFSVFDFAFFLKEYIFEYFKYKKTKKLFLVTK